MYLYNDLFSILLSKRQKLHRVCVEITLYTERKDVCIGLVIIYFGPSFNFQNSHLWEASNMREIVFFFGQRVVQKKAPILDCILKLLSHNFGGALSGVWIFK